MGQIRQLFRSTSASQAWVCALFTAHEYFSPSGVVCFKAKAADAIDDAKMAYAADTTSAHTMAIANYGAIYGIYAYDLDGTGTISAQITSDSVIVGTLDGAGVLGRNLLAAGVPTK